MLLPLLQLLLVASDAAVIDKEGNSPKTRIDCYPEPGATKDACTSRFCIWEEKKNGDPEDIPWCYMKASQTGYQIAGTSGSVYTLLLNGGAKNPWGDSTTKIRFTKGDVGNGVVSVRFDTTDKRYDTDEFLKLPRSTISSRAKLSVSVVQSDPFAFQVKRADDNTVLFDTSIGGLIFSDKLIQVAATISSDKMYGWGENIHPTLKHDFTRYTSWGMFARDEAPNSVGLDTRNLYGVHPFYLALEPSGKAHGVFFLNSNAQEVTTIPAPGLVYRTIGGFLDIYFFPGPKPSDVIEQYQAFIGTPFMPPYWALGFQLCRWGYKSLQEMKDRVGAVRAAGIPIDVAYADIDYMARFKDFTSDDVLWAGFGDYVRQMHDWGMHSILIFDPAVEVDYDTFQRGRSTDAAFIEWERSDEVMHDIQDRYPLAKDTKIMLAGVWPDNHVAFPDFLDPTNKTTAWWTDEFKRFHDKIPFDGAWIDMNEPSVFDTQNGDSVKSPSLHLRCPRTGKDSEWDQPPYKTQAVYHYKDGFLAHKTLCMRAVTARGAHRFYNTKNLYGWSESRATQTALQTASGKRGAVISRSTFASAGRYGGHWLGDNHARWEDLRSAVIGVMEFNMFGISYVGSDVCGFNGDSNEELCLRWQQLGAFHSFYRNHNAEGHPFQDPAVWPSVGAATKAANEFRYAYLPYLYTLHFQSSMYGTTVIRPLFFEYPSDAETHNLSEQFMWGANIIVAPVVHQGATTVSAYIPSDDYYSLYGDRYGGKMDKGRSTFAAHKTLNAPTFVRGGAIIPRHRNASATTTETRKSPLSLLIVPGKDGVAFGDLFWDDGDRIIADWGKYEYAFTDFSFNLVGTSASLTISTTKSTPTAIPPALAMVEIFNFPSSPNYATFQIDGSTLSVNTQLSKYSPFTKIATIVFQYPVDYSQIGSTSITWKNTAVSPSKLETNRVEDA